MDKFNFNPAMYYKIDSNNNPIFYENSGLYVRPKDAKDLIQALTQYLETADFETLECEETKYFYEHFYKEKIGREMAYKSKQKNVGVVYFLKRKDGLIKIGCSSQFDKRLTTLKREHGELEIIHTIDTKNMYVTEFCFHNLFEKYCEGGEWFQLNDDFIEYIKDEFYYDYILLTIMGHEFDYDLYFEEYYSRKKVTA